MENHKGTKHAKETSSSTFVLEVWGIDLYVCSLASMCDVSNDACFMLSLDEGFDAVLTRCSALDLRLCCGKTVGTVCT